MKRVCLMMLLFIGFTTLGCAETKLIPFEQNDLWGYKTTAGKIIIQPRYYRAENFSQYGIAAVCDPEQSWIYIDTKGNFVIKPMYYDNGYDPFMDGLARYEEDGKVGFFNEKGDKVIPAKFEFAYQFQNGLAVVAQGVRKETQGEHTFIKADNFGFIDKKGNLVIPYKFEKVYQDFEDPGFALVVLDGKEVKIDRQGEVIEGQ